MAFEIAIPEDDNRTFGDYLDALKRRRKPALVIALALLLLGGMAIFLWPNAYTSTAAILIEDPDIPPGLVPTTVTTFANAGAGLIRNAAEAAMTGSRPEDTHCDMFAGCTVRADEGGEKASSAPRQMRSVWLPSAKPTVDVATNGDVKGTLRNRSNSTWPARTVHVSGDTRRLKQGRGRYSMSVSITASTSDMPIPVITLTGSD